MTREPIPAATLVLFRDHGRGAEHLFVERAATMTFAAGAIVFPGGRVDPDDRVIASAVAHSHADDAAGRVAAIRETIEETGIAIGLPPETSHETVNAIRAGLFEGRAFSTLMAERGLGLDLDTLVPFARWCPKLHQSRNFDTRFYIARADANLPHAEVDATENVRLFWASAQTVLDQADAGAVQIIFPTRRNLERLAALSDFDDAVAHAAAFPPVLIEPWIERSVDGDRLRIPDDRGYPVTSELLTSATRG